MKRGIVALLFGMVFAPAVATSEIPPASGPDLTGEILQIPAVGTAAEGVPFTMRLINQGREAAGPFSYRLLAEPDPLPPGVLPAITEEIFTLRLEAGLEVEEAIDLRFDGTALPLVKLPTPLRGDLYRFVLVIDAEDETGDLDRTNNRVYSAGKMTTLKPALRLSQSKIDYRFPSGACVLGEAVEVSLELCNTGNAAATNFQPGAILGAGDFVSFLIDPVAVSAPPSCGSPLSQDYQACAAPGEAEVVCAAQTCRQSCEVDADCAAPLRCLGDRFLDGAQSCMAAIEAGAACQTFHASGRIPRFDRLGKPNAAGEYRLHFSADTRRVLSETTPHVLTSPAFHCSEPLPDLAVIRVEPAPVGVAGEPVAVSRHLRNLGFIAPVEGGGRPETMSFDYRYYLAAAGTESSSLAIPLELQATGGAGVATLTSGGDDVLTDLVVLPPQLPAGNYHLTLLLDPDDRIVEATKANNLFTAPIPIEIRASPFRIVTLALPAALEGGLYLYQFAAVGGSGAHRWSARGLPPGFTMDSDGLLRGLPREAGSYAFEVRVSAGDMSTSAIVALQIQLPRGMLGVATQVLPSAIRGLPYGGFVDGEGQERQGVPLAAVGGVPPYVWELAPRSSADRLPQGLVLQSPSGIIQGEPSPLSRTSSFVVRVRDSLGAEARAVLELQVVADGDLVVTSRLFDDGLSAQSYASCVEASGGDRSSDYGWTVDPATIPAGLSFEEREGQACLVGTPSVCGNYLIDTRVSDGAGQSFHARIPLSIECDVIRISTTFPSAFARGEEVEVELGSNAGSGAAFRRYQGELPPGLVLDGAGRIAGIIDAAAAFGAYDFLVEVRDATGRQGLTALTMRVQAEPREAVRVERETSSCGAAGSSQGGLWAGLLVLLALLGSEGARWRRSSVAPANNDADSAAPRDLATGAKPSGALLIRMLLFTFALAGCEATTEIIEQPLCQGVICGPSLECDPVDGLCKCDGAFCTGEQVCLPDPKPHCGEVSCEYVHCDRGQSCEPGTGRCACQGEVCADDELCTDAGCVRPSSCEGVQCSGALRCDPEGGQCKCGGEICTERESCVEGSCVEDLCAGVHCGGAEVCDPADGRCHCGGEGGPICQTGEACNRDEAAGADAETPTENASFSCSTSERCDHGSCGGGTTCDPSDGSCRCGGVGRLAPACSAEQICLDGVCRGGSLCASVVCEPGFSCDGTDGLCKCGGAGGLRCEEGQICTVDPVGAFGCRDACTIQVGAGSSCVEGEACYIDRDLGHGGAFCAPSGPMRVDDPCAAFNDCGPGLFCSPAKICRRICHPSEPVEVSCGRTPGAYCLPFGPGESQQSDLGYCITNFG